MRFRKRRVLVRKELEAGVTQHLPSWLRPQLVERGYMIGEMDYSPKFTSTYHKC
jgi:hypothetical protein